jgi:hypothetical protein
MKIVGVLLIIGILFSYVPVIPMDDCPEGNHMGNMKMDCGNVFHCPLIINGSLQEPFPLPLSGWLILPPILPKVDELTHLIFHPPKTQIIHSIS